VSHLKKFHNKRHAHGTAGTRDKNVITVSFLGLQNLLDGRAIFCALVGGIALS
jgi:hypothetical protein